MTIQALQSQLLQQSQLRSISIAADGKLSVAPLATSSFHSLEVSAHPAVLGGSSDCQPFQATTRQVEIPCAAEQVATLIDPVRWGDFSEIQTSNCVKSVTRPDGGWQGTIEERLAWKLFDKTIVYQNLLNIDFAIAAGASVDFTLKQCLAGGLNMDSGYLRLVELSPNSCALVCQKQLSYAPPSDWCLLPTFVLDGILDVWLNAITASYAHRMLAATQSR
ncbi:hypothetical protein HHL11_15015 [Ramlibacter sp. G-1-2-2]|uniref:Uncharacterized protein n=1 Tax=Ramlibacter agri TaxID=2728837 RepID=A0A848H3I8_9BURK|nr:hypothetical protein [Ramlibacter agri]NML45067.1 hypothetical protein [Ramlibacter agri]